MKDLVEVRAGLLVEQHGQSVVDSVQVALGHSSQRDASLVRHDHCHHARIVERAHGAGGPR
jgi:hypothetical protein